MLLSEYQVFFSRGESASLSQIPQRNSQQEILVVKNVLWQVTFEVPLVSDWIDNNSKIKESHELL